MGQDGEEAAELVATIRGEHVCNHEELVHGTLDISSRIANQVRPLPRTVERGIELAWLSRSEKDLFASYAVQQKQRRKQR